MEPVNNNSRKRNMFLSVIALLVTAGLAFLLFTSLKQMEGVNIVSNNFKKSSPLLSQNNNQLALYNEQLLTKLNNLRALDEQFTGMMISTVSNKNYDSLNNIILQQEEDFRQTIESIKQQAGSNVDKDENSFFSKIIASFKSLLESRKSVSTLRNAVAIGQSSFTPDEKALFKLQEELMSKTNRVKTLEKSLSDLEKKTADIPSQLINAQNAKFADSIKFVANVNVLENKIATITSNMNNLRQENDRLQKQQNENAKNLSNNESLLREKNGLQQRLESLNAELQLARADCNLSRADATQTISTSKQRKQLLSETSSILTDLSVSGNAEVKRKAQEKIVRLNQLAANTRD